MTPAELINSISAITLNLRTASQTPSRRVVANQLVTLAREVLAGENPRIAAADGTVKTFLVVLRSKLTQQDKKEYERETARGGRGNIYRLGLLFEAADKVEADVRSFMDRDDAEAMEALKSSLQKRFNSNFPPLKNMLKQIEVWETKQKAPSLVK